MVARDRIELLTSAFSGMNELNKIKWLQFLEDSYAHLKINGLRFACPQLGLKKAWTTIAYNGLVSWLALLVALRWQGFTYLWAH